MKKVFLSLIAIMLLSVVVSCGISDSQIIGEGDLIKENGSDVTSGTEILKFESPDKFTTIYTGTNSMTNIGTWQVNGNKLTTTVFGVAIEFDCTIENDIMTLKFVLLNVEGVYKKK